MNESVGSVSSAEVHGLTNRLVLNALIFCAETDVIYKTLFEWMLCFHKTVDLFVNSDILFDFSAQS